MIDVGNAADEGANAVVRTRDGGLVIAGYVEPEQIQDDNAVLMKLGPQGRQIWRVEFGDDREDRAYALAQAPDGGYAVAGQFGGDNDQVSDAFLIKTDAQGKEQWRRVFDGPGHDLAMSVEAASDSGYLVGIQYDLFGDARASVAKTDANGVVLWQASAGDGTHLTRAAATPDGGCVLAWWEVVPAELLGAQAGKVGILKVSASGAETWRKVHDIPVLAEVDDIRVANDGGYVLAGQYDLMSPDSKVMLWKTDAAGEIVWQKTYDRGLRDAIHSVRPTRDGGYVLAGMIQAARNHSDMLLMKTDATGTLLWERAFGGEDTDEAFDVVETQIGYAIVGTGESFENDDQADNQQIVAIKTDGQGHCHNGEVALPTPVGK
jgi:hypothetical protein